MCLDTRACIILMNSTPGDIYPHIANVSVLAYMKKILKVLSEFSRSVYILTQAFEGRKLMTYLYLVHRCSNAIQIRVCSDKTFSVTLNLTLG